MNFLLSVKFKSLKNTISKLNFLSSIKLSIGIIIAVCFLLFLYIGFYRLLVYVNQLQLIGPLLLFRFLAIAFLTAFVMVILSSIIVSFSTMFFSTELNFLLSLPIKPYKTFLIKLAETVLQSSWMMFVALIPFIFAYAKVKNVSVDFFVVFAGLSIPFFSIATAVGIFISFTIMYFFPGAKSRDIVLLLFIFFGATAYVIFRFVEPEKLANPDAFLTAMQYIAYLNAPVAKFLPSWWFTEILNATITSNQKVLIYNSVLLLSLVAIILLILLVLANRNYYKILANIQFTPVRTKPQTHRVSRLSRFTLITKDIKTFFRDTRQWSQVILVIALILVYLFSIYRLPKSLSGTPLPVGYICNFLSFLNIGAAGFILSALALRFAFTQFSLEKGTLWFILSIPKKIESVFANKIFLTITLMIVVSSVIGIFSNILLNIKSDFVFGVSTLTIVLLAVGLTALATGLGAIYPKFDTDNIAQIETSYGGILFMISALVYIGFTLAIEAAPMQMFIKHEFGAELSVKKLILHSIDLLLLNIIVIFLPIWRGIKSIRNYELQEWSY